MKHWLPVAIVFLLLAVNAQAQRTVDLFHYTVVQNPVLISFGNPNSMAVARFETEAPAKIKSISAWFFSPADAQGDTARVYILARDGGGAFPYFMQPYLDGIPVYVAPNTNEQKTINFQQPLTFNQPTSFFIAVQVSPNFTVLMDNFVQTPACITSTSDSIWTNSFAAFDPQNGWTFGYMLNTQQGPTPMYNWYIGVKVEYFDEGINTVFTDVSVQSKINLQPGTNTNRRIAWADYDKDGWQDALWGGKLLRNKGNGTFEDVSATKGYTAGSDVNMFADLDNDGWLDILCMPSNAVYFNKQGVFQVQPNPGFVESQKTQAMAFIDIDADKLLDVFVANGEYKIVQNPANPAQSALVEGCAWPPFFYVNSDAGTSFLDTKSFRMANYLEGDFGSDPFNTQLKHRGYRPATAAQWVDYDNDGDPDLYVGIDRFQPNYLLSNTGASTFQFNSLQKGIAGGVKQQYAGYYGNTLGFDWGDYDGDGDMDLLAAHALEPFRIAMGDLTCIFQNSGEPNYAFTILSPAETRIGYTDIYQKDAAFGDFNNDGLLDFVVTSGEKCFDTRIYMQNADHTFTNMTWTAGIDAQMTHGVAWVDYDNDGDLDLSVVSDLGLRLYRNNLQNPGNWAKFDFVSDSSNHFAVGTQFTVFAGGNKYLREVTAGRGAGSQNPYTQHVGLGTAAKIDSVVIRWPSGQWETMKTAQLNGFNVYTEHRTPPDTGTIGTGNVPVAGRINLGQNYPNPFNKARSNGTSIAYNLPNPASILVEIYNSAGALVKTLVDKQQGPGTYYVQWDGRDDMGNQVPTGTYQYVLKSNGSILSKRMVVLQ